MDFFIRNSFQIFFRGFLVFSSSILLHLSYQKIIFPKYSYFGFPYFEPNNLQLIIFSLVPAVLSFFLPKKFDGIHSLVAIILFFQFVLPVWTVPLYTLHEYNFEILFFAILSSLVYLSLSAISIFPKIYIPKIRPPIKAPILILFLILSGLIIILYQRYGFNPLNIINMISISDIYLIRNEFRLANEGGTFFIYILMWATKVITPFCFIFFLYKKKYLYAFLTFIVQFCFFSISGHKSLFLGLFFVLAIYYILKMEKGVILISSMYLAVIILSSVLALLDIFPIFLEIIVRRMIIMSGLLSGFFVEFFSVNGFDNYSNSFLAGITESPYDRTLPFIIGEHYFGRTTMSANANFLASAYANFGYTGVLIESSLLIITLYMIKQLSRGNHNVLYSTLFILPMMSLADSAFFTSLLTHGILCAGLFLFCFRGNMNDRT